MAKAEFEATIKVKMLANTHQEVRATLGEWLSRLVTNETDVNETDIQSVQLN